MRKVISPILVVTLVLLGISLYLNPVEGSTTTTTTTTNTTYTNTTWTNTSLPPQVQQLVRELVQNVSFPIIIVNQTHTAINQTHTVTTQTTSVQTSTTKVTAQQWYVQYTPGIVMVILLTILGLLYKRHSKK